MARALHPSYDPAARFFLRYHTPMGKRWQLVVLQIEKQGLA